MKESALTSSNRLGGAVISDRIVASLLEELRTGRYARADRLPAEVDLAAELGVSRTVIRDALSEMERAGYVERVRGIGTVVNRAVLSLRSRLDQKLEYYPLIRSFGSYPHADGIQVFPIRAGEELARDLEIEPGDDVICIKKRILADTTPVIYSIDYLPRALFGARDYTRIDLTGGVFDILERECHQQISSNVAHLKASCGDDAIRSAMRLAPGEAMLLLDEVCFNRLCRPVNFMRVMQLISQPEPEFSDIVDVISCDTAMCQRLLRLINSVYFGVRNRVSSIGQALVILGLDYLREWIYLMGMQRITRSDNVEIMRISCLLAKFCKQLALMIPEARNDSDAFYLMGLLSMVTYGGERALAQALEEFPLTQEIKDGLMGRGGVYSDVFDLAYSYEKGDWATVDKYVEKYHLDSSAVSEAFVKCVKESERIRTM